MKIKFSGRRPVMFYQPGLNPDGLATTGPRIRIVYPDGNAEWCMLNNYSASTRTDDMYQFAMKPCWLFGDKTPNTLKQAVALANKYDREVGFPKMEMVCEL